MDMAKEKVLAGITEAVVAMTVVRAMQRVVVVPMALTETVTTEARARARVMDTVREGNTVITEKRPAMVLLVVATEKIVDNCGKDQGDLR